jgi:hypothetical protein
MRRDDIQFSTEKGGRAGRRGNQKIDEENQKIS